MINLHERKLPDTAGIEPATFWLRYWGWPKKKKKKKRSNFKTFCNLTFVDYTTDILLALNSNFDIPLLLFVCLFYVFTPLLSLPWKCFAGIPFLWYITLFVIFVLKKWARCRKNGVSALKQTLWITTPQKAWYNKNNYVFHASGV